MASNLRAMASSLVAMASRFEGFSWRLPLQWFYTILHRNLELPVFYVKQYRQRHTHTQQTLEPGRTVSTNCQQRFYVW